MKGRPIRKYLLSKPEAVEDFPFGKDVSVFKVREKMFALLITNKGYGRLNLKCDPQQAFILRVIFSAVIPGYHMNKKHWNTVILDGTIPSGEIERMIDHSYALVVKKLKKIERKALELAYSPSILYRGLDVG